MGKVIHMNSKSNAVRKPSVTVRTNVKPKEQLQLPIEKRDPQERFRQLANKRVPRLIKEMRLLCNLASDNYRYTDDQAGMILSTLEREFNVLKQAFRKSNNHDTGFRI